MFHRCSKDVPRHSTMFHRCSKMLHNIQRCSIEVKRCSTTFKDDYNPMAAAYLFVAVFIFSNENTLPFLRFQGVNRSSINYRRIILCGFVRFLCGFQVSHKKRTIQNNKKHTDFARKISVFLLARRKGFEPRPTERAPFRSAASGTAPYPLPRFSSPNCAGLRNLVSQHALRMIRFAQKTLRVLRSGVRIFWT